MPRLQLWRIAPSNQHGTTNTFRLLGLFLVILASAPFAFAAEPTAANLPQSPKTPKVLLIGIDGLRVDALKKANTPALDQLAASGSIRYQTRVISDQVTNSDTISGPGWTTYLTGTWADRHGVLDNSFKGRKSDQAPHLFRLAKQGNPDLVTASFLDWTPLNQHVTTDADVNVIVSPNAKMDEYVGGDETIAHMAAALLASRPIDIAFVYLGAVDETGHKHGFHPTVKPYMDQIETTDRHIQRLLEAIAARPTYDQEDWLVVVGSDHGGEGTGHGGGRENSMVYHTAMIVSGDAALPDSKTDETPSVSTTDIAAVALTHLGITLKPEWKLAGDATLWLKPSDSE